MHRGRNGRRTVKINRRIIAYLVILITIACTVVAYITLKQHADPIRRIEKIYEKGYLAGEDAEWLYDLFKNAPRQLIKDQNHELLLHEAFSLLWNFIAEGSFYNDEYTFKVIEKIREIKEPSFHEPLKIFLRKYKGERAALLLRELLTEELKLGSDYSRGPLSEDEVEALYRHYSKQARINFDWRQLNREPQHLIPVLHTFIKDDNWRVRYRAALTLANFRDTLAIPILEEINLSYLVIGDSLDLLDRLVENRNIDVNGEIMSQFLHIHDEEIEFLHARYLLFENGDPPSIPFLIKCCEETQDTIFRNVVYDKMKRWWKLPVRGITLGQDLIGFVARNNGENILVIYKDKIEKWDKW